MKAYTKYYLLAIILLTMYNNLEHSAGVYYNLIQYNGYSDLYNRIQSYLVVIVIDLSVIAFITHSRHTESRVFAFFLFLTNMLFFGATTTLYQLATSTEALTSIEQFDTFLTQVLFSGIFSYVLHRFSLLYHQSTTDNITIEHLTAQLQNQQANYEQLEKEKQQTEAELQKSITYFENYSNDIEQEKAEHQKQINEQRAVINELTDLLQEYKEIHTCKHCKGYHNLNIQALRAHEGACKKNTSETETKLELSHA